MCECWKELFEARNNSENKDLSYLNFFSFFTYQPRYFLEKTNLCFSSNLGQKQLKYRKCNLCLHLSFIFFTASWPK